MKNQENKIHNVAFANNNSNAENITTKLTLRQLKSMLPSTTGQKRSTPKSLRESGSKVVLQIDVLDSPVAVCMAGCLMMRLSSSKRLQRTIHTASKIVQAAKKLAMRQNM